MRAEQRERRKEGCLWSAIIYMCIKIPIDIKIPEAGMASGISFIIALQRQATHTHKERESTHQNAFS